MTDTSALRYPSYPEEGKCALDKAEFNETKTPRYVKPALEKLTDAVAHADVCLPTPIPGFIEGKRVVVIGCSTGRDAFLAAALVGERGHVIGVDPCEQNIAVARANTAAQMRALCFDKPNIEFLVGCGEALDLKDASVDVVVVNALFNVSPDQDRLLDEALRVLVNGGELYISSIFVENMRLSDALRSCPALRDSYLSGALYASDFRRMLAARGINAYRYVEKRRANVKPVARLVEKPLKKQFKQARFFFATARVFKLFDLEDSCENYHLNVTYKGTALGCEQFFDLDETHRFYVDEELEVCGNTFSLLKETRFSEFFDFEGNRDVHHGIYDYCGYCSGGAGGKFKDALGGKGKKKGASKGKRALGSQVEQSVSLSLDCTLCGDKDCSQCRG